MHLANTTTWLVNHPVFVGLANEVDAPRVIVPYVEGFAPVVNSVPVFLHLTLSRATEKAAVLLRDIWNDELGLGGTPAHPVLFDSLYQATTTRWGSNKNVQNAGISAAIRMIELCGSGLWPIGVAAMRAHESQFPVAYARILPTIDKLLGSASEFFRVHSEADIEHTNAGSKLLDWGISQGVVSQAATDGAVAESTRILRELMDAIWCYAESS